MPDHSNMEETLEGQPRAKSHRFIILGVLLFGLLFLFAAIRAFGIGYDISGNVSSAAGRTNILVMGIGGKGHEGSDLTDTMVVASVSLIKPSLLLVSIPRDIWMPDIRAKVNSAYHYGGTVLAKKEVEEITGFPIHYGVLIDFSGFKDVVDVLGGIQVNVERSFTDSQYPIAGKENDTCGGDKLFKCRYETISFSQGLQTMSGATALKFVRSRHAEGTEGTDTAREARQQKVIEAIKNKLLSASTLINPVKDLAILNVVKNSIETDMGKPAAVILGGKVFAARNSIVNQIVPQDLLVNPPISKTYDKQYVFIPKEGNGNWKEINSWFSQILK